MLWLTPVTPGVQEAEVGRSVQVQSQPGLHSEERQSEVVTGWRGREEKGKGKGEKRGKERQADEHGREGEGKRGKERLRVNSSRGTQGKPGRFPSLIWPTLTHFLLPARLPVFWLNGQHSPKFITADCLVKLWQAFSRQVALPSSRWFGEETL